MCMQRRHQPIVWLFGGLTILLGACAPATDDGLSRDGRAQCNPVSDSSCRPLYCPTGSKHECASQDLCDNFFSFECFDPTVDVAWSSPQTSPPVEHELTAPFSAAGETALWRIANPWAPNTPNPKYQRNPLDGIRSSEYIELIVEQFVQPALSLEASMWNDLLHQVQTDPEYLQRTAKKHALIYESMQQNSEWLRLFSRLLFGEEHGSMAYCRTWIDHLNPLPDINEFTVQLDYVSIMTEVSWCLDVYRQTLAYLWSIEERSQLFSKSHTVNVLSGLEATLDKFKAARQSQEYLPLLESEYDAIADIHDTLQSFIAPLTSMLQRAQASYAWLQVKTPGVFRREAPTEIGLLAQRAAHEAYHSSIDPLEVGSWQERYRRALIWYAETRNQELDQLRILVDDFLNRSDEELEQYLEILEGRWYFWGLMEASGLLELYPEYTEFHAVQETFFQQYLERVDSLDRTLIACAGFALSFIAPTVALRAAKGVVGAAKVAKATAVASHAIKLALGAAILAAMQTASAHDPEQEESALMAMLRDSLPQIATADFWKYYGGLIAETTAEAFAPSCFSVWEYNRIVDDRDNDAPGLAHLNSLTSLALHVGMTGTDSLVDPDMEASADPAWVFLLLPSEHPEYAVPAKKVVRAEGYDLFAKSVGMARASRGESNTGRTKVPHAAHLSSISDIVTAWGESQPPIWDRLQTAIYGLEDWTPKHVVASQKELGAELAKILSSNQSSRYDETWMELIRHMRSNVTWSYRDTEEVLASTSAALGSRARVILQSLLNAVRTSQQADSELLNDASTSMQTLPYQGLEWQQAGMVIYDLQQMQSQLTHLVSAVEHQVALASTVATRRN